LEDLTRLISEIAWEVNSHGKITYISDRVFETLGLLPIQIIGKTFSEIGTFHDKSDEEITINWNNPFREVLFKTTDQNGKEKQILLSGVPYYTPETWDYEGVTGTAKDISSRVETDNNLKDALRKAEWANQAKTEFLSTINHELRTPLTSIKGSVDLLKGIMSDDMSEKAMLLLEITIRNSETLLNLIDEMLDYEKVLSGEMVIEKKPHDLGELIIMEATLIQDYTSSLGISINCNINKGEFWAETNEHRFGQILRNLLSNAAKFSHEGGQVEVFIDRIKDKLRVSVKDHGVGISEENTPKIFERFIQIDSSDSRKYSGTGLGLSICRALTLTMGGTINFTSEIDVGSTFYIEFPELIDRVD
jgi:PAS domain S-box-containing protein